MTPESRARFFDQLEERLRALPGVTGVASTGELPAPSMNRNGLSIEGVTWPAGEGQPFIAYASVSDDFFRTMRIPLREGRTFGPTDRAGATTGHRHQRGDGASLLAERRRRRRADPART